MAFEVRIQPIAFEDILDAAKWYEAESPGLGSRFTNYVYDTIEAVGGHPQHYQKLNLQVRRAKVKVFPYIVLFIETQNQVVILGVVHIKRSKSYWRKRFK